MERKCYVCGAEILECMGGILVRDLLPYLEGRRNDIGRVERYVARMY
jgi:hypothetical protein